MEPNLDRSQKNVITVIYFHEQYHSPHCWETVEQAITEYGIFKSETQNLRVMKEQILTRLLGLGWEEAHHPWSHGIRTYTADDLFNHLIDVVIPLADWLAVSSNPPASLPSPPDIPVIATNASIDKREGSVHAEKNAPNAR